MFPSEAVDLKKGAGDVYKGEPKEGKPGVTMTTSEDVFVKMAAGELNGQQVLYTAICVVFLFPVIFYPQKPVGFLTVPCPLNSFNFQGGWVGDVNTVKSCRVPCQKQSIRVSGHVQK